MVAKVWPLAKIVNAQALTHENLHIIDDFAFIDCAGGLHIGRYVHIAGHSCIVGGGGCTLGDFSSVAWGARILTGNDDFSGATLVNPTVPAKYRGVRRAPVNIGRHAIVSTNSIVLPNVTLHEGAILAANSLAKTDIPAWEIWGGTPARKIGERKRDLLELEAKLTACEHTS